MRKRLLALLAAGPCGRGLLGRVRHVSSDLLSKDAEWFSRPGRLFISNVSIEAPPLTPNKPVTAGRSGQRRGLLPGNDASRRARGCQCADGWRCRRAAGARQVRWRSVIPNAMSCAASARPTASIISNNGRGDRVAVVTYLRGQRAGIYTFTAGRLTSIERAPEAEARAEDGEIAQGARRSRRRPEVAPPRGERRLSRSPRHIANLPPAILPRRAAARSRRWRAPC